MPKSILFGVACYDEHMRVNRVDEDARMEMLTATGAAGTDLLSGTRVAAGGTVALKPRGVAIVEEGGR